MLEISHNAKIGILKNLFRNDQQSSLATRTFGILNRRFGHGDTTLVCYISTQRVDHLLCSSLNHTNVYLTCCSEHFVTSALSRTSMKFLFKTMNA